MSIISIKLVEQQMKFLKFQGWQQARKNSWVPSPPSQTFPLHVSHSFSLQVLFQSLPLKQLCFSLQKTHCFCSQNRQYLTKPKYCSFATVAMVLPSFYIQIDIEKKINFIIRAIYTFEKGRHISYIPIQNDIKMKILNFSKPHHQHV